MTGVPAPSGNGASGSVVRFRDSLTGAALTPTGPLVWRRSVPMSPEFELRQGDVVLGEMEPANRDEVDASAECLGRALEFRVDRAFLGRIRVEACPASENGGLYAFRGWFYGWGELTTPSGEILRWRHALLRMYDHLLTDGSGAVLLRLRPAFLRFARTETRVLVDPRGWDRPDLPELLLVTWFLRAHSEARGGRVFRRGRNR